MSLLLRFSLCALGLATIAAAKNYVITVAAPAEERVAQVVTIKLPAEAPETVRLRAASGETLPLQAAAEGTARFVIPTQVAGARLEFSLESAGMTPDDVTVARRPDGLHIAATVRTPLNIVGGSAPLTVAGGSAVVTYRTDKDALPRADIDPKYKRAGYLHPLRTPAGHVVTGDYPTNHIHHHGIWSPWTKTQFQGRKPDFWNMQDRTGTVEFDRIGRTWSGPVHGGFMAHHRMVDLSAPTPTTALNEAWEVTFYPVRGAARPLHVIDLVITQTCATADALFLPQYHYGGLGLRGRDEWNGKANLILLTSDGATDRVKANAQRMRWCYLGGAVEGGAVAGVAVLDHPENFRAPQPVRVHPDMPYLSVTPSQLGDWAIEPGKPYVARYRFIAFDGAPDRALLDAAWAAYATPVKVTIEAR